MMTNSASRIWQSFFLSLLQYFLLCSSYFQGKPIGAVSAFTTGNYPRQPVTVYLFVISINFSFMLEFKPDVIKDISSAKMSHSFAAVEIYIYDSHCNSITFCAKA